MAEMKKGKKTNKSTQDTTNKTKYYATQTLPKTGGDIRCSGRVLLFVCLTFLAMALSVYFRSMSLAVPLVSFVPLLI